MTQLRISPFGSFCLAATLLFVSLGVRAERCYEQSPLLKEAGEAYYDTEFGGELTSTERAKVQALFRRMAASWRGESTGVFCTGPDRSPVSHAFSAQINANFDQESQTRLKVHLQRDEKEGRIESKELLEFFGPHGRYEILDLNENQIFLSHRLRQAIGGGQSRLMEIIAEISVDRSTARKSKAMYMNLYRYANGVLILAESIELHRH